MTHVRLISRVYLNLARSMETKSIFNLPSKRRRFLRVPMHLMDSPEDGIKDARARISRTDLTGVLRNALRWDWNSQDLPTRVSLESQFARLWLDEKVMKVF